MLLFRQKIKTLLLLTLGEDGRNDGAMVLDGDGDGLPVSLVVTTS